MKIKRAIYLGIIIWMIGVLFFTISQYVPIIENADTQANIVLFVVVMPLVWYASNLYYKKDHKTHGYKVGQTFLLTAVVLDAFITVPLFVIPYGGNHFSFFTSFGFWMIAFEFLLVAIIYYYINIYPNKLKHLI